MIKVMNAYQSKDPSLRYASFGKTWQEGHLAAGQQQK